MDYTKKLVKEIVKLYITNNPIEFDIVKRGIEMKRKLSRDEYATLEGSSASRALYEIPETLSTMFVSGLSEEQMLWFKSKQGAHWFCKNFDVFKLPNSI